MLASIGDTIYLCGIIYAVNRWYQQTAVSTQLVVSDTPGPVGRPRINGEQTMARFREGTLDRIKAVLGDKEKQSDFIREAVEEALDRRETAAK